jgi:hypothetical protein
VLGGASASVYTLRIDGGNVLSDGSSNGVRFASFTTTPSLYDPNVTATGYQNGLGRATLYIDNVAQSGYVLVAHGFNGGGGLQLALVTGAQVLTSSTTVAVPLASDATQTVNAYVPYTL